MTSIYDRAPGSLDELARFASRLTLEDVPDDVRHRVKLILLDSFACALAADHGEEMAQVRIAANALGESGSTTVIGEAGTRGLAAALILNGFRITAMTACDYYAPVDMHIGPEVIPSALAIAERESSSGEDLLTALAVGFEVTIRVVEALADDEFRRRNWHTPGVAGPFGAGAAVASLLGLDERRALHAISIAGGSAAGTWAARGTPVVKIHQARAALNAVLGALLAAESFTGSADILATPSGGLFHAMGEGGRPDLLATELGSHWHIDRISLRLWPGGARVQPAMSAAAAALAGSPEGAFEAIDSVVVGVPPRVKETQAWASSPASTFEALASLTFTVATILRRGEPSFGDFVDYGDPVVREFIANKLVVQGDDRLGPTGASVTITYVDGTTATATVQHPVGSPESPPTDAAVEAKLRRAARGKLTDLQTDRIIDQVMGLERLADVRELLSIVRRDRAHEQT